MAVSVVVSTVSDARSKPRWVSPFERDCTVPAAWASVQKCIDTHEKGASVRSLSVDVKVVEARDAREYLFVRFGKLWQLVYRPGDASYEVADRSDLMLRGHAAFRIDLVHHVPIARTGDFFERVSLVCEPASNHCDPHVTACTVTDRGHAVETFHGELKPTADGVMVVGDRSYTGMYCRSRF